MKDELVNIKLKPFTAVCVHLAIKKMQEHTEQTSAVNEAFLDFIGSFKLTQDQCRDAMQDLDINILMDKF